MNGGESQRTIQRVMQFCYPGVALMKHGCYTPLFAGVRARLGGEHPAHEHEEHDAGGAELHAVLRDLALRDTRGDLPDDPSENCVALRAHDSALPRFRIPYAIRDWS